MTTTSKLALANMGAAALNFAIAAWASMEPRNVLALKISVAACLVSIGVTVYLLFSEGRNR